MVPMTIVIGIIVIIIGITLMFTGFMSIKSHSDTMPGREMSEKTSKILLTVGAVFIIGGMLTVFG